MRKLFIALSICCAFTACIKKVDVNNGDLSGNIYIQGRVFYIDNINSDGQVNYLPNIPLKIGYAKDSAGNYIYNTASDANGYFNFKNLNNGSYCIFVDTTIANVKYSARSYYSLTGSIDTSSLILFPSEDKQNGLVYKITDSAGTGPVNNVTVCLFSNFTLAAADTCIGSNYNTTSNPAGRASIFNLVPSQKYIALFKLQVGNISLKARDTVTINQKGITRRTVKLHS